MRENMQPTEYAPCQEDISIAFTAFGQRLIDEADQITEKVEDFWANGIRLSDLSVYPSSLWAEYATSHISNRLQAHKAERMRARGADLLRIYGE